MSALRCHVGNCTFVIKLLMADGQHHETLEDFKVKDTCVSSW